MASKALYNPNVTTELGNAHEASRSFSPCRDHIENAAHGVIDGAPIYEVMDDILSAMAKSTNVKVLFSLSQAVAWIGPMGE